jgi:tetratricopeptide (TPR) repeat protein
MTAPSSRAARHPDAAAGVAAGLVERFADSMTRRWGRGERPLAEEYLDRAPALWGRPEAALELVAEELVLRQEYDEPVRESDLVLRFPQWAPQVGALLACHRALAPSLSPRFPGPGDALGDFRLVAELGRGGHGRVFLAAQPSLADRPVVLKLAPPVGHEHLSLARLQHTHIVPLYSAHNFPELGLQGLCMPYFGGVTLAAALAGLRDVPPRRRTGRDLLRALDRAGPGAPAAAVRRFFEQSEYVRAVCWVGACLADALHYAHERGLLHLDLKPSNILLAADGQPMLLDFHLAHPPLDSVAPAPTWLGGTPGRMAPEHEAALAAVRAGRPVPAAVDGRADVYPLGLLLCEALGGEPGAAGPADLRRRNPRVTAGLAAVLARCLTPDPAGRYRASELAADLRRHLADLPLRGVAERSPAERWAKWRRRRPLVLPLLGLAAALAVAAALLLGSAGRQVERARDSLRQGHECLEEGRLAEALDAFRYGQALAEELPWEDGLAARLRDGVARAERGQAAVDLHELCERLRPLYGADRLPPGQVAAAEEQCRRLWGRREVIADRLGSGPGGGPVRADLLDLALLWSQLHTRHAAPGRRGKAREEALAVLAEAETLCGPSRVLLLERAAHARALGREGEAEAAARAAAELPPRTAWEHYALGRAYFHAGDAARAAGEMDRALALEPDALWPNFYKGNCALRAGQAADAVAAFSACVALSPRAAWCFHSRGLAYLELGRSGPALADFDRAMALDPGSAPAALSRATLHRREGRYPEALADLRRARECGAPAATASYHEALVHLALDDRAAARAAVAEALRHDPDHPDARALADRLGAAR